MDAPAKVVVIGGGVAGLTAGLGVARRGHAVTVVERDDQPLPGTPDDAFDHWLRPGVPQIRQGHNFLARTRSVLARHAPDVLSALLEAGAGEHDQSVHIPGEERIPEDAELVNITCRRTTFEWALRRALASEAGVEFRRGAAAVGLRLGESDGIPAVTGLCLGDCVVPADVVVDAAGRRSPVRGWLRAAGVSLPLETVEDCGITYVTRHYRLRPSAQAPELRGFVTLLGDLGYMAYFIGVGDRRTFCVSLGVPPWDSELRAACLDRFEAITRSIPALEPWSDPGLAEPIMDAQPMAGNHNVLRPFMVDGRPAVLGLLPVGDSLCTTDVYFGWGVPLALSHGFALADAVATHPGRQLEQVKAFQLAVMPETEACFATSVADDRERSRRWRGEPRDPDDPVAERHDLIREGVLPGTSFDPDLCRAWLRRINLLDRPNDLFADPELVGRAEAIRRERSGRAPRHPIPTRADLLAMAGPRRPRRHISRTATPEEPCRPTA
jgi:2-polyprenyl-6-methoxyphenol hydroxylase-like FAD-dependent oxidoreductase